MWAQEYNAQGPRRRARYQKLLLCQFNEGKKKKFAVAEHFIDGEYVKFNTNTGKINKSKHRGQGTAQAFSHFTWEASGHTELVCDIQGNRHCWTDAAIHTKDGRGYGRSNLGMRGINAFFATHKCNEHCIKLGIHKKKSTGSSKGFAGQLAEDADDDEGYRRHIEYNAFM